MNQAICSAFTNNDTLAFFSSDSVLHLWDVKTGKQTQQYLPSSHLTATFTCLSWKEKNAQHDKKPNKTSKKSEFIALGTATGEIVLYNVENGELVLKYSGGHTEQVNCISWTQNNNFYSCSDDGYITEWGIVSAKHKDKWKADKRHLYSLCVGPHSRTILAAGKMIKLWDLKSKTILQKFNGHTSPILSLMFLNLPSASFDGSDDVLKSLDGLYAISAAREDRALSAWHISSTSPKKISVCSFSLPSEPYFVDVLMSKSPDKPVWLLVGTEDDQVAVFSRALNGYSEKPFLPCKSIKIVTEDAQPLKLICACFNHNDQSGNVVITVAYGSSFRVAFEHIKLKKHEESEIILIRKDPAKSEVVLEQDKLKIREATKSKNFSSIAPGVVGLKGEGRKRKRLPSINEGLLSLEKRVAAQSADVALTKGVQKPDSMAVLLTQGLQSDDQEILEQVLQHSNDSMIKNTVGQIPINYVIPLIKHLTSKLPGLPVKCLIYTKWLKATLSHHSSFLTTLPTAIPLLDEIYQYIEIRKQTHNRLPSMQGKLDLLLSQIASKKHEDSGVENEENRALLVFEEVDSSDEYDDTEKLSDDVAPSDDEWNGMEYSDDNDISNSWDF